MSERQEPGDAFDEFSEGRKSLESWQWDLIGGVIGIVVAFGVGWWVAGLV